MNTLKVKQSDKAATLTAEHVKELYEASILRDSIFRPRPGFSSVWSIHAELVHDKTVPWYDGEFTDVDLSVTPAGGVAERLWSSTLFNSIVMTEEDLATIDAVDAKLQDKLISWDDLSGKPAIRFKDVRTYDGSIVIKKEYEILGGVISKSKLGIEGIEYKVPLHGLSEGALFLEVYNLRNKSDKLSIQETDVKDLLGAVVKDADGNKITAPSEILIKGDYGRDPYLSPITLIIRKFW